MRVEVFISLQFGKSDFGDSDFRHADRAGCTCIGPVINAVIDRNAFQSIKGYLDFAKKETAACEIVIGGGCDDREGWFIEPTVVRVETPRATVASRAASSSLDTVILRPVPTTISESII